MLLTSGSLATSFGANAASSAGRLMPSGLSNRVTSAGTVTGSLLAGGAASPSAISDGMSRTGWVGSRRMAKLPPRSLSPKWTSPRAPKSRPPDRAAATFGLRIHRSQRPGIPNGCTHLPSAASSAPHNVTTPLLSTVMLPRKMSVSLPTVRRNRQLTPSAFVAVLRLALPTRLIGQDQTPIPKRHV